MDVDRSPDVRRTRTNRPSPSARCRSGAGTPAPNPNRWTHRHIRVQDVRQPRARRSATPTSPASARPRSTGCARIRTGCTSGRIGFSLTRADGSAGDARGPHGHPSDAGPLERRHHQPLPARRRGGRRRDALPPDARRRGRARALGAARLGPREDRRPSSRTAPAPWPPPTGRSPRRTRTVLTQVVVQRSAVRAHARRGLVLGVAALVAGRRAGEASARTPTGCRRPPRLDRAGGRHGVRAGRAGGAGPDVRRRRRRTRAHWNRFWSTGGAIDLSGSTDPRWRELERRIVLSQYLTAIQCAGRFPPQETGLTFNSWEGKFHLEMHWWHAAQFALWDRLPLLERSLGYYDAILPKARATAARQGYAGARWPKMTSPTGDESPSNVGPFLVWQQPHPIFYAELVYRARPTRETLERFRAVVFATAEFMASFPAPDAAGARARARAAAAMRAGDLSEGPHQQLHLRAELLGVGPADGAGVARAAGAARATRRVGPRAGQAGRRRPSRTASTCSPRARRTPTRTRGGRPIIRRSSPRSACCPAPASTAP